MLLVCWIISLIFLFVILLVVYVYINGLFILLVVFVSFGVFKVFEVILFVILEFIIDFLDVWVLIKCLEEYFNFVEVFKIFKDGEEVKFDRVFIVWLVDDRIEEDDWFVFCDISVNFLRGEFFVIFGKIGMGKSLMLVVILGEVDVLGGIFYVL